MAIAPSLSRLFSRPSSRGGPRRQGSRRNPAANRPAMVMESLEKRAMLAIDAAFAGGILTLTYNAPDANNFVTTANQNAVVEVDEIGPSPQSVRVNLYRSSNPNADVFTGVTEIIVNVPGFDLPGVNNNSLTIKGLESPADRIIMVGSGRTTAGRWFDQLPADENQILFEITGIDNLTLTAGGTINVSGSFTNDTADASITVIGTSLEALDGTDFPNQHTATIVLGENTPPVDPNAFPQPRLESNYIHVIGAAIEINSDIYARGEVSLKTSEFTAATSNLLLPYDITVDANPNGTPGRLDLFSAKSVIQQSTSTIQASLVNVVAENTLTPFAAAVIDLSSHKNDFDEITIRTGTGGEAATGSVAIRDCDDLVIANESLLSTTGLMTIHADGLLTIDTPIKAGEFKAYSGVAINATKRGSLTIGDGGIALTARATTTTATGDITLNGRVEIGSNSLPAVVINNSIRSDGVITIAGGFYAPQGGATLVEGLAGVLVASPVQVGHTFVDATSTVFTVTDADLTLVSSNGFVDILDFSGNAAIPQAVQVTNMLSIDAFADIFIDGQVFVGTRYGNVLSLPETIALPNIFIRGKADITIGESGRLETSAYENNVDLHVNPLLGRIRIVDASQFTNFGSVKADGAIEIDVQGDVYSSGGVTARESITVATALGIIDIQGAMTTTGYVYTTNPPQVYQEQRIPNIILSAPSGSIVTGGRGILRTGTLENSEPVYGEVRLDAQQGIILGADIISAGGVIADVLFGGFELDALLQAGNDRPVEIRAADGIYSLELGRFETSLLQVTVPEGAVAADIDLPALANRVGVLEARNFTPGGDIRFATSGDVDVRLVQAFGDVDLAAQKLTVSGQVEVTGGDVSLSASSGQVRVEAVVAISDGDLTVRSDFGSIVTSRDITARSIEALSLRSLSVTGAMSATTGDIVLSSQDSSVQISGNIYAHGGDILLKARQVSQGSRGVRTVEIISGGSGYTKAATVTFTPPQRGGVAAEGRPLIAEVQKTDPEGNPLFNIVTVTSKDGTKTETKEAIFTTVVTGIEVTSPGAGYEVGESVLVSFVDANAATPASATALLQDLVIVAIVADQGDITIETTLEGVDLQSATASGNITVNAFTDIDIRRSLAAGETIDLVAKNGALFARNLRAGEGIALQASGLVSLANEILADTGNIDVVAEIGGIETTATIVASAGAITLQTSDFLRQSLTGIEEITITARGRGYRNAVVVVNPPAGVPGVAATARPIIDDRDGLIVGIEILTSGSGYEPGEVVGITIGSSGDALPEERAFAFARASRSTPSIVARDGVTIAAARDIELLSVVRSDLGDIKVTTAEGDIRLADSGETLLHAEQGKIEIASTAGGVSARSLLAQEGISVRGFGSVQLEQSIYAREGDITVGSESSQVTLFAGLTAVAGGIDIAAGSNIFQLPGSGLIRVDVQNRGSLTDPALLPDVRVAIAAPQQPGGRAATAVAEIGQRFLIDEAGAVTGTEYFLAGIRLIDPGLGYEIGEVPEVSIENIEGATVAAIRAQGNLTLLAKGDVTLDAIQAIVIATEVVSLEGDISLTALNGEIDLGGRDVLLHAQEGQIAVATQAGGVVSQRLLAGSGIEIKAHQALAVLGDIVAYAGDVDLRSKVSNIDLQANLIAFQGGVFLDARSAVTQASDSGLVGLDLITGGRSLGSPLVRVEIAPPAAGGEAASATAILGQRAGFDEDGEPAIEFFVDRIILTDPGRGYSFGESPAVEIIGLDGAVAVARGPVGDERILAREDIEITAGGVIRLTNRVTTEAGDILIRSTDGDLDLGTPGLALHAVAGGVELTSDTGFATVDKIFAGGDITVTSLGNATIQESIVSATGDIRLESTTEDVSLGANIEATDGSIAVAALGQIYQNPDNGLRELRLISGGFSFEPPSVRIRISPPAGGGAPAEAVAVIGQRRVQDSGDDGLILRTQYFIAEVILTNPGQGYAIGESPAVTIGGLDNAAAIAIGPSSSKEITAAGDIAFKAGVSIRLSNKIHSDEGSIDVFSGLGGLILSNENLLLSAPAGKVSLASQEGTVALNRIFAGDDVAVTGLLDVTVSGDISTEGGILVGSATGRTIVQDLTASKDIVVSSSDFTSLTGLVVSNQDIIVEATNGSIRLAAGLKADGAIELSSLDGIQQEAASGLETIEIISEGAFLGAGAPDVTIEVEAPLNGGIAARAEPVFRRILVQPATLVDPAIYEFSLERIVVITAGEGYAVGEVPGVSIQGLEGAQARAVARVGEQSIVAGGDVMLASGGDVRLRNRVRSEAGDIVVESTDGVLTLDDPAFLAHAVTGSVTVITAGGSASVADVIAGRDITVGGLSLVRIAREFTARTGTIAVTSSSGAIDLQANLHAEEGGISLTAYGEIVQTVGSGVSRIQVTNAGRFVGTTAPEVTVTIAPPAGGGGTAATATAVVQQVGTTPGLILAPGEPIFGVVAIVLTSPGSGYAVGENPAITIEGVPGAGAVAFGPESSQAIVAKQGIGIAAGSGISLLNTIRSNEGTVSISSIDGNVALPALVHAVQADIAIAAVSGAATIGRLLAGTDISVTTLQALTTAGLVSAGDDITLESTAGRASVSSLAAGGDILVRGSGLVTLAGDVVSIGGGIVGRSVSGDVSLNGTVHAQQGGIEIVAHGALTQADSSGLAGIELLNPGRVASTSATVPEATVTIAAPLGGGEAATALALIGTRTITGSGLNATTSFEYFIESIELLTPGSGYAIGETPTVTITGMDGAIARALPLVSRSVVANTGLAAVAGGDVTLRSTWRSNTGDVAIASTDGDLNLDASSFLAHAVDGNIALAAEAGGATVGQLTAGTDVTVTTLRAITTNDQIAAGGDVAVMTVAGAATVSDVVAGGAIGVTAVAGAATVADLIAAGDVTVTSFGLVTLRETVSSSGGDIVAASQGAGVLLAANILAPQGAITITAQSGIAQQVTSGITAVEVISGGSVTASGADAEAPDVTVTIQSPAAGGVQATAVAVVGRREAGSITNIDGTSIPIFEFFVESIVVTNPGEGYAVGESPLVTIEGLPGATARAVGLSGERNITALNDITIGGGTDVKLVTVVRSDEGNVLITSVDGDLDLSAPEQLVHAVQGDVSLSATAGGAAVRQVRAGDNIAVNTLLDLTFLDHVNATRGDITARTISGDLNVRDRMHAEAGSITLTASDGRADIRALQAGKAIDVTVEGVNPFNGFSGFFSTFVAGTSLTVTTLSSMVVEGEQTARAGNISFLSRSGAIDLSFADVHAIEGAIRISAHGEIRQAAVGGLLFIELINQGAEVSLNAPAVTVEIAAPAGGGQAAKAVATVSLLGFQEEGGGAIITPIGGVVVVPPNATPVWGVTAIEIIDRGLGYASNESPEVSFEGIEGASARAYGPSIVPFNIVARDGIDVTGGETVTLTSIVRSNAADVAIRSIDGNLDLSAENQLVHAVQGSILLETLAGGIKYQRVIAGQDITMRSHETLTIDNQLTTNGGDVSLASTGNDVVLTANVLAADTLAISAKTGIQQNVGSSVKASKLQLVNTTATPITLTSPGNDVERFSALNVGDVSYVDDNDFRVGLESVGPMGIAVTGNAVILASTSPQSVIRVVGGMKYRTLAITAGTLGGSNVGTVEFVTTTNTDNPASAANPLSPSYAFTGSLRDMIRYANDNLATVNVAGKPQPQPQAMVFDEELVDGNGNPLPAVGTITVGTASLPAFTRPITFDGSRVLPTVPGGRLGLLGRAGLPSGLHLGLGSSGSRVTGAAVFGFTTGSGVIVESGNNTVDNMYVGLRPNGVTVAPNRLGVNVSGVRANSNTIGTVMYNSLTDGVVSTLRVTNRGERAAGSTPNVTVTIAPPVGGGTAATAQAVVEEIRPGLYGLTGLVLTNPGSGYEIGENPRITFVGMPGATANSVVAIQTKANHLAGNSDAAIVVQRGASTNLIAGNVVGVPGRTPNRTGVRIDGGSGNQVGTAAQTTDDLTPTPSNLIRGNTHYGVEIRNVRGATTVVENNIVAHNAVREGQGVHGVGVLNSMNVRIGGVSELAANQIHSQTHGAGVHLSGSTKVAIVGNHIGTDGYHLTANGHFPDAVPVWPDMGGGLGNSPFMGNGRHGIDVFGRSRDVEITANRIVDNRGSGVAIASGSSGVVLTRNEIGAWVHPVTGNIHAAGNLADGVTITAANGNTVGSGNVIGFNKGSGVHVENSVAAGLATGNQVAGAEIFGNSGHGVNVSGSSRQTIGGAGGDDGNIIKENLLDGIRLGADPRVRASAAPHGNLVSGNFVGTNDNEEIDLNWGNRNGISVIDGVSNVLSRNTVMNNRDHGIEIAGGVGNTVGGQTTNEGNFIGYNFSDGVYIHDQASTRRDVGVTGTVITAQGAGYAASRTNVIFTAPAAPGGSPARGVALVSADGRVTGIRLTLSGSGYTMAEAVSVTIFDPLATASATATVTLGTIQAVSSMSRGHVVSGNEIEANAGAGVHVMGDRTTEVQVGQNPDNLRSIGAANKISFHLVGVLVNAAMRTRVQGNVYGDNDSPLELINGANDRMHGTQTEVLDLRSTQMGIAQTLVTGELVNGGAFHQYSIDVYDTPYFDINYDTGVASGHQMRRFLGRALVTTNEFGRATISMTISQAMELGDYVSVKVTSTRFEPGTTVGVFHSEHRHRTPPLPTPSPRNPTPTPTPGSSLTPPSNSSGTTGQIPTPPRGSVPPSRL